MLLRQRKHEQTLGLCIPGGLAGQLFGLAYAAWINQNLGLGCRIVFFDVGTSISKLAISPICESDVAKQMGISLSRIRGHLDWNPSVKITSTSLLLGRMRGTLVYRKLALFARSSLRTARQTSRAYEPGPESVIRRSHIRSLRAGSLIAGYPTDYQIVEDSSVGLLKLMRASGLPNFLDHPGQDDSISIHWRLGDYVNNSTHGALSWEFFKMSLQSLPADLPVTVFTDSPDLARKLICATGEAREVQIASGDIFEDLFRMTRSKYFIGSHSGISFLAAMALHDSTTEPTVTLPSRWFKDEEENKKFQESSGVFGRAIRVDPTYLD
ncbi:MAG: hypothetical protein RI929_292 [Actinomycetota bacterium]